MLSMCMCVAANSTVLQWSGRGARIERSCKLSHSWLKEAVREPWTHTHTYIHTLIQQLLDPSSQSGGNEASLSYASSHTHTYTNKHTSEPQVFSFCCGGQQKTVGQWEEEMSASWGGDKWKEWSWTGGEGRAADVPLFVMDRWRLAGKWVEGGARWAKSPFIWHLTAGLMSLLLCWPWCWEY